METIWLGELEEKVRAVGTELDRLRKDNLKLTHKVSQLEKKAVQEKPDSKGDGSSQLAEVKRRVEGLVEGLERLLAS